MEDEQFILDIREGKELAFEAVVHEYSKLCWVIAYSILGKQTPEAEIEELVSDVFLRLWKHPDKYDPEKGSLKNYLVLMTKSMAINKHYRLKQRFETVPDFPLEEIMGEVPADSDAFAYFFEALQSLKEPTRQICLQRFYFEKKPAIISDELNLSKLEVNNRLYKGKKKIQRFIIEKINQEGLES